MATATRGTNWEITENYEMTWDPATDETKTITLNTTGVYVDKNIKITVNPIEWQTV